MRGPAGEWRVVDSVDSTQRLAASLLDEDVGVVLAREQTGGVGRFGRPWHSPRDTSLSMTLILREHQGHPAPQYLGMAVALAAAAALRCQVAWPNDLVVGRKKLGGVLTEIVRGVPLVGVGVNLDVEAFPPELADRATSLRLERGGTHDPRRVAHDVVRRLDTVPEPDSFAELAPIWSAFDRTPGKPYRLPTGELAFALGVGADGRLLCTVDGETHAVMAADATFG